MSLLDNHLSIDTPENVTFGYDVAGIGSRFLAAFIDTLLIMLLLTIVNMTMLFLTRSLFGDSAAQNLVSIWIAALFGLISFFFFWGYYILFEMMWNGQSPGKRWLGLRVLKTDGTPITLVESIIRNLVRLVDFLPAYYGLGVVTMFVNDRARRLGDLAAGTLVVYDTGTVTLEELSQADDSLVSRFQQISPETEKLPLERLTSQDLHMIEDFLRRRADLANRTSVAIKILDRLYETMEVPPIPNNAKAEDILAEIYKLSQSRTEG